MPAPDKSTKEKGEEDNGKQITTTFFYFSLYRHLTAFVVAVFFVVFGIFFEFFLIVGNGAPVPSQKHHF